MVFVFGMQKELHECVQHIQDPSTLREHVTAMYRANVNVDLPSSEMDANVVHEYHRHKVRMVVHETIRLIQSHHALAISAATANIGASAYAAFYIRW